MKRIQKIIWSTVLLFSIPGIVRAEVLSNNWWSARRTYLHAARHQICEVLDEPQTPFGTEIRGDVEILSADWKNEGNDALYAALDEIDAFLTQMGANIYE